jgi:L-fuconolactonase
VWAAAAGIARARASSSTARRGQHPAEMAAAAAERRLRAVARHHNCGFASSNTDDDQQPDAAIIDVHTHFYDPSRESCRWPEPKHTLLYRKVLPSDWEAVARPCGVTHTVVVAASTELLDNEWVLQLAERHPCVVGLCGYVQPDRPEFAAEIRHLAANPLFCGVRVGPPPDLHAGSLWWSDMALLAELGLQLDILQPFKAQNYEAVLELAVRLPSLRIVINHIALIPVNGDAVLQPQDVALMESIGARPNIFMKVSGTMEVAANTAAAQLGQDREPGPFRVPTDLEFYRPCLELIWRCFGEDRIVYGSNWPVCDHAYYASSGTTHAQIEPGLVYRQQFSIVDRWIREKGPVATRKFFVTNARKAYRCG